MGSRVDTDVIDTVEVSASGRSCSKCKIEEREEVEDFSESAGITVQYH